MKNRLLSIHKKQEGISFIVDNAYEFTVRRFTSEDGKTIYYGRAELGFLIGGSLMFLFYQPEGEDFDEQKIIHRVVRHLNDSITRSSRNGYRKKDFLKSV